jgi:Rrf2 family transcriptional repressor of oqxAB
MATLFGAGEYRATFIGLVAEDRTSYVWRESDKKAQLIMPILFSPATDWLLLRTVLD